VNFKCTVEVIELLKVFASYVVFDPIFFQLKHLYYVYAYMLFKNNNEWNILTVLEQEEQNRFGGVISKCWIPKICIVIYGIKNAY